MAICRPSSDRPSYGGLASDSRRDFRPVNVRFGSKASTQQLRPRSALPPKADLPPDLRTTPAVNSERTPPSRPRVAGLLLGKSIQPELGLLLGLMPHSVFRNPA